METNIQKIENCKTIVTLKSTKKDEWGKSVEKAYKKLEAKVTVPGFRKGKAPSDLLRSHIKLEDVFNEALNSLLADNYSKVLEENELRPVVQPSIDVKKVSLEEVELTITVIGEPKVELKEYKGIKIEKEPVGVTDSEIEEEIKRLQENNAEIIIKENGVVDNGDIATIDFEGFVEGKPFDGGKASDYDLTIGSKTFIPGFEDQIIGMKLKDSKEINVKFPENYVENLKGKDATFKVTVKNIKTKVLPEINDDLALDASFDDVENLEQLKEHYKKQLITNKQNENDSKAFNKLIDNIMDNANYDIANEIIDEEVKANKENIENRLTQQGLTLDNYLKMLNMKTEDFDKKLNEDCTKNLKYIFTLLEIAKKENIKVEEADFDNAYKEMADQYKMTVEDVKKALSNRLDALANDILTRKVTDFLRKENNI